MSKYVSPKCLAKQILLGTMLGDCSIQPVGNSKARVHMGHSDMQFEYLLWKMWMLQPLVGSFTLHRKYGGSYSKTSTFYARTLSNKFLRNTYEDFYKQVDGKNIKKIRLNVLRRLTPLSLAVWHMDDGCLVNHIRKSDKVKESYYIRLCTHGFMYSEQEIICKYFKEMWDLDFHILPQGNTFFITTNKESQVKFINIIKPYIHESMAYKIDASIHRMEHPKKDDDILRTLQGCRELIRNDQPAIVISSLGILTKK